MVVDFLGIGVPRGGSTWLWQLLSSHPQVFVSQRRKELHYFDREYGRGRDWYERFFPAGNAGSGYRVIGEVTPHYVYSREAPQRIAQAGIRRLIVILREPVSRAYSHFAWRRRLDGFQGGFDDFLDAYPEAIEWGLYAQALERYLQWFSREEILVLVFEHMFRDITATCSGIARFLDIDPAVFPPGAGGAQVNSGHIPRHHRLARVTTRIGSELRRRDIDWLPNLVRRFGLTAWIVRGRDRLPPLPEEVRSRLSPLFREDSLKLEELFGLDLRHWIHARHG